MNWNKFLLGVVLFTFYNKCNCLSLPEKCAKPLPPVILVHGYGGSQIEARLDGKPGAVHYICDKETKDWFTIWLTAEMLFPVGLDCWMDNFSLIYDNKSRTTRNAPGVEIRVPSWGNTKSVEWLESSILHLVPYFNSISNALVANGYVRNVSIRAAPYDFRKAPNEHMQWFSDLKTLVEETYEANNKIPVTFISHSNGGPMTLLFLEEQDKIWKSKYISRVISIAAPWGGSFKSLKAFALGDDLKLWTIREKSLRINLRKNPSIAWQIPTSLTWGSDDVLVQTNSRNYTVSDLEDFFKDMNDSEGWEMRKDTVKYNNFTQPPDVEFHCLYGSNVPTIEKLIYSSDDLNSDPKLISGDGDGSVNSRSLEGCSHWTEKTLRLPHASHMQIVHDKRVLKYILEVLIG